MTNEVTSISVSYRLIDGWNVFTSKEIFGLYVASKDAERAYTDVQAAIEKLLKLNDGIQCKVTPVLPFSVFIEKAHARSNPQGGSIPRPRVLESQQYLVSACA